MKKTLLLLFAACICNITFAQGDFISEYFSHYEKDPAFNSVKVTQKTFSLFTEIKTANEDEQRVLEAIAKLNGIKVLHQEKTEEAAALYTEAADQMAQDGRYEELASVQTQEENFIFVIREEDNIIRELTIIAGGQQQFILATLYGEIDLKNISRLTTVIKDNGKEWFAIFENIDSDELVFNGAKTKDAANEKSKQEGAEIDVNVFPNPVSDYVQLQATGLSGTEFELSFFSFIGEPIKKVGKVTLPYTLQLEDLPSGAYFLRLTNAEGAFKNYRIVKP